jgi:hypothetical protein
VLGAWQAPATTLSIYPRRELSQTGKRRVFSARLEQCLAAIRRASSRVSRLVAKWWRRSDTSGIGGEAEVRGFCLK